MDVGFRISERICLTCHVAFVTLSSNANMKPMESQKLIKLHYNRQCTRTLSGYPYTLIKSLCESSVLDFISHGMKCNLFDQVCVLLG